MNNERENEVRSKAGEIVNQIGLGNRMAIGLRDLVHVDGYSRPGCPFDVMVFGKVLRSQKYLEIVLENNDTYTIRFLHLPRISAKNREPKVLSERSDVYAPELGETCYSLTHKI